MNAWNRVSRAEPLAEVKDFKVNMDALICIALRLEIKLLETSCLPSSHLQ